MSLSCLISAPASMSCTEPSCRRTVDGIHAKAPPSLFIYPDELRGLGSAPEVSDHAPSAT